MDFKNVFITLGIGLLALTALFTLASDWNEQYGTSLGYDMNATYTKLNQSIIGNLTLVSKETGDNSEVTSGASAGSGIADLITRSLAVIGSVPRLLGLIPAVMSDAASIIGIPPIYIQIATWLFIISFALVLAYIFLTGARSFI